MHSVYMKWSDGQFFWTVVLCMKVQMTGCTDTSETTAGPGRLALHARRLYVARFIPHQQLLLQRHGETMGEASLPSWFAWRLTQHMHL